jgi:hypothetical protein
MGQDLVPVNVPQGNIVKGRVGDIAYKKYMLLSYGH